MKEKSTENERQRYTSYDILYIELRKIKTKTKRTYTILAYIGFIVIIVVILFNSFLIVDAHFLYCMQNVQFYPYQYMKTVQNNKIKYNKIHDPSNSIGKSLFCNINSITKFKTNKQKHFYCDCMKNKTKNKQRKRTQLYIEVKERN